MTIRPMESRDVEAWADMRARFWPEVDEAELLREADAFVTAQDRTVVAASFVAEDEGAMPVGFIEVSIRPFSDGCDSTPVPHVEGWFVEPAARGGGVGKQLMTAAEDWARSSGFEEIASDTAIGNDDSLRAHQACGFEEVERLIKFRKTL